MGVSETSSRRAAAICVCAAHCPRNEVTLKRALAECCSLQLVVFGDCHSHAFHDLNTFNPVHVHVYGSQEGVYLCRDVGFSDLPEWKYLIYICIGKLKFKFE